MAKRRTRIPMEEFMLLLDVDQCHRLYEEANATRGEIPCVRHHAGVTEDGKCRGYSEHVAPPAPHETCPRCFTWRDCTDEECEHPACGHGVSGRFRDAWLELNPDLASVDVFVGRSDAMPLIEHGRLREIAETSAGDDQVGRKMLDALTRRRGQWQQIYDMPIDIYKGVEGEVWLHHQGVPVEATYARYRLPFWIAYTVARDLPPGDGGATVMELRLGEAPGSLERSPGLTQGALF